MKVFVFNSERQWKSAIVDSKHVSQLFIVAANAEEPKAYPDAGDFDMEDAIQNIESLALIADQMAKINVISTSDTESFYNYMIEAIDKVNKAIRQSDNVYKFFNVNGVLRIMSNNLMNPHPKLRTKLLLLLKDIFNLAPTTAESLLPLNIVDRLVDIYENDNNLALKAHALDILYKWLPNNPKIQVRIMKITTLETLYKQVNKLDIGVVQTLMELFNLLIKEHLNVRNDKAQIIKDDGETMNLYQSIGLLEHMSTPKVCNGLLNILEMLWSYNRNENDHINTILELIKNVQPFCLKIYKKKTKAVNLFEALLKYVKDEERKEYLEKHGVDEVDVASVLERYLGKKFEDARDAEAKDEF